MMKYKTLEITTIVYFLSSNKKRGFENLHAIFYIIKLMNE